jgi:hypothetical protein
MSKSLPLLAAWLAWSGVCHAQSQEDLVKYVRAANRAAVEAVHTLSCKGVRITTLPNGETKESPPEEYYYSEGTIRVRQRQGQRWTDVLVKDGRMLSLSNTNDPRKRPKAHAFISPYGGLPVGNADPMFHGLFKLVADAQKGPGLVSFDECMNHKPHTLRRAERVSEGGRELIVLKLEFAPDSWAEYYFDPAVNHLLRKIKSSHVVGTGAGAFTMDSSAEVLRFREGALGVFFPEEVVYNRVATGKPLGTDRFVFRDLRVNQPLPPGALDVGSPKDAVIEDAIQGKSYKVDAHGKQVGESQPLAMPGPPSGAVARTETREEPRSWSAWILPASLALLGAAGVLWLVRKRRGREEA